MILQKTVYIYFNIKLKFVQSNIEVRDNRGIILWKNIDFLWWKCQPPQQT